MKLPLYLLLPFFTLFTSVSAQLCRDSDSTQYKCGGANPPFVELNDPLSNSLWTHSCSQNDCCCHDENGWGYGATYQRNTCADQQGDTAIGCFACAGTDACINLDSSKVGDYGCVDNYACANSNGIIVGQNSCIGEEMCSYCETGSDIPNETCNDVDNRAEVSPAIPIIALSAYSKLLSDYGFDVPIYGLRNNKCRACFVS